MKFFKNIFRFYSPLRTFGKVGILLIVVYSIFVLANIFTGWFWKGTYCAPGVNQCTYWRSFLYLNDLNNLKTEVTEESMKKLIAEEQSLFLTEIDRDSDLSIVKDIFLDNLRSRNTFQDIEAELLEHSTISEIIARGSINDFEKDLVKTITRQTYLKELQQFASRLEESTANNLTEKLEKVMPHRVNLNEYVRFFDHLQKFYHTPKTPFILENIKTTLAPKESELYDEVDISFSLTTTVDLLKVFLRAIYLSGDLTEVDLDRPDEIFPFLEIEQTKIAFPKEIIQNDEDFRNSTNTETEKLIKVDMKLIAYLMPITKAMLSEIEQEIEILKNTIEDKKTTGPKLSASEEIKQSNIEGFIYANDKDYNIYKNSNDLRKAYEVLLNMKELYTQLLKLYS